MVGCPWCFNWWKPRQNSAGTTGVSIKCDVTVGWHINRWKPRQNSAEMTGVSIKCDVMLGWLWYFNRWKPRQNSAGTTGVCIKCDVTVGWRFNRWKLQTKLSRNNWRQNKVCRSSPPFMQK